MEHLKSFKSFESVTKHVFGGGVEYLNDKGQRHREDGPAVEWNNGDKSWYLNGQIHRINGPAIEYSNGDKFWYLDGKSHREGGPAIEYSNGGKEWWLNDKRHRIDGPAVEYPDGGKQWCLNGKCHREDGPAVEWGISKYWFLNGSDILEWKFIQKLTNQTPNPDLFRDLPIEDLEELSNDLCDKYDGEIKKWCNFYAIYFKEKLDPNDPDLKSFENRIKDFRIRVGVKSILVY